MLAKTVRTKDSQSLAPDCGQINIFYVDKKFIQLYVDKKIY